MEQVVLVDELDNEIGTMDKMEAHQKGALHRAFSILLFNSKGEALLQKRAITKYHSGGLWTNTCCSHPRPGEQIQSAVTRNLKFEMGIDARPQYSHKFLYKVVLGNLIEHELDHVFIGKFDGQPVINKQEVDDWKFITLVDLHRDLQANPKLYSHWFRMIMKHKELALIT